MFGKLENDILELAPREVLIDGKIVKFPTDDMLIAIGYHKIFFTEQPNNPPAGYVYSPQWSMDGDTIKQTWIMTEEEHYDTAEEIVNILTGVSE